MSDEPQCTCARSGKLFWEPEFECDVHGDLEAKAAMTVREHASASTEAVGAEDMDLRAIFEIERYDWHLPVYTVNGTLTAEDNNGKSEAGSLEALWIPGAGMNYGSEDVIDLEDVCDSHSQDALNLAHQTRKLLEDAEPVGSWLGLLRVEVFPKYRGYRRGHFLVHDLVGMLETFSPMLVIGTANPFGENAPSKDGTPILRYWESFGFSSSEDDPDNTFWHFSEKLWEPCTCACGACDNGTTREHSASRY